MTVMLKDAILTFLFFFLFVFLTGTTECMFLPYTYILLVLLWTTHLGQSIVSNDYNKGILKW